MHGQTILKYKMLLRFSFAILLGLIVFVFRVCLWRYAIKLRIEITFVVKLLLVY